MGFNLENNIRLDPSLLSGIEIAPLIGESIWHSIVTDPSILPISKVHYERILGDLHRYLPGSEVGKLRILEVGAYAHISGYMLAQELGCAVTLFDLSANTLRQGHQMALANHLNSELVTRVAGDFHELPFDDQAFDIVYACSTLHHTWRWQNVLSELTRIVAPNGILILDNEPCRREFCFYNFRINRMEELSPAQRVVEKYELTRTVAEPFGGSRPEMLFGMIENHQMPLECIISETAKACCIEEISLTPLVMNSFEQAAHQAFCQGPLAAKHFIMHDFSERLALLGCDSGFNTGGLLTPLPGSSAIAAMADKIANLIEAEGYGENSRMPYIDTCCPSAEGRAAIGNLAEKDPELATKLSQGRIFGAGVRMVARRSSTSVDALNHSSRPTIRAEKDGIRYGFSKRVQNVLDSTCSLLPSIQSLGEQLTLMEYGPDWIFSSHGEIHVLYTNVEEPQITIRNPSAFGNFLVAFRLQVICAQAPWQLHLSANSVRQCWIDVVQSESTLLLATVPNVHGALTVKFTPTLVDGVTPSGQVNFSISRALAFTV